MKNNISREVAEIIVERLRQYGVSAGIAIAGSGSYRIIGVVRGMELWACAYYPDESEIEYDGLGCITLARLV